MEAAGRAQAIGKGLEVIDLGPDTPPTIKSFHGGRYRVDIGNGEYVLADTPEQALEDGLRTQKAEWWERRANFMEPRYGEPFHLVAELCDMGRARISIWRDVVVNLTFADEEGKEAAAIESDYQRDLDYYLMEGRELFRPQPRHK